jgi:hypothetical protein
MRKMIKKITVLIFISIFTLFGFFAHAQVRDTDIVLSVSPQYPSPNQSVVAVLSSAVIDLNTANISWSVNNQEVDMGIGEKSFTFTTGSSGSNTTLSATINTIDGQNISKTMTITPAGVDMLWEAGNSYTPPFYEGKALVPSQGTFKVVAVPNVIDKNGQVNSSNLAYAWTQDGNPQPDSSGWGKNYFIFQNSYLDKGNTVQVAVSDISGNTDASGEINLQTTDPKILFYEDDPSLGEQWETALSDGSTINSGGETIIAEPYFFSPNDVNSPDLTFNWSLGGQEIPTPDPQNILSIKPNVGQSGSTTIDLTINNVNTLFQSMEKQINVNF